MRDDKKARETLEQLKALFADLPAKHKKDIAAMIREEKVRDEAKHRVATRPKYKENPVNSRITFEKLPVTELRKTPVIVARDGDGNIARGSTRKVALKRLVKERRIKGYYPALIPVSGASKKGHKHRKNPVPTGTGAKIEQAKRRYKSFRDQPVTDTVKIKAPKYEVGAKSIGYCKAIDYTTYRGEENNFEKYRHKFAKECAPVVMKSADGHFWSSGGRYRFTYRGFLDQPKAVDTKADIPPFDTAVVVGYLDGLHIVTGRGQKILSFKGKKVLLCVSESGYNFFTVKEP